MKLYKVCPMCGADEVFRCTSGVNLLDTLVKPYLEVKQGFKPDYAEYEYKEDTEYDDWTNEITNEYQCNSCGYEYNSDNIHDVVRNEMITREEWKAKGVIV